jgi:hypothetical protein
MALGNSSIGGGAVGDYIQKKSSPSSVDPRTATLLLSTKNWSNSLILARKSRLVPLWLSLMEYIAPQNLFFQSMDPKLKKLFHLHVVDGLRQAAQS